MTASSTSLNARLIELFDLFLATISGDLKSTRLEQRLFNIVTLFNGGANIGGAFVNFALVGDVLLFSQNLITGILFIGFWIYSRFYKRYEALYWPFVFLIVGFLSAAWFANQGSKGGSHYYLIVAFIIAAILSKKISTYIFTSIVFFATTGALFWFEYFNPESITEYPTRMERFVDISLNFGFVQFFSGVLILVLSRNINQERAKSDQLLLNILPEKIVEELKVRDHIAPRHFESATVLFTDFVGFTQVSETMTPEELVSELDDCFRAFDAIMARHGIEKIKTIGDSYMAVGGIPEPNETHAADVVRAGLEVQAFMRKVRRLKIQQNKPFWECRLGVHSGPLVASVIGDHKFAYDVWGDSVNLASRMESSGESEKVNISEDTYQLIKNDFKFEHRGKIKAKNKGEVDMYFVLSQNDSV